MRDDGTSLEAGRPRHDRAVPLILGSASARRLELLGLICVVPDEVVPADIDESPKRAERPREYACRMAREKAEKLLQTYPDANIITADTVVAKGRRILPKGETTSDVVGCLKQLSGCSHRVYTAVAGSRGFVRRVYVSQTRLTVKRLSPHEIDLYAQSREGIGCAGGYAIQGLFSLFVLRIVGSHHSVMGLPTYETGKVLHDLGIKPLRAAFCRSS